MEKSKSGSGPDFLCVGQQKAGTGWLYDQLQVHPGAWMPPIKELNYFVGEPFRSKYIDWLSAYKKQSAPFWRHPFWKLRRAVRGKNRITQGPGISSSTNHPDLDARFWKIYEQGTKMSGKKPGLDWYCQLFPKDGGLLSGDITPGYSTLNAREIDEIREAFPHLRIILFLRDPVSRTKSAISMSLRKGHMQPGDQNDPAKVLEYLRSPAVEERSRPSQIWQKWNKVFGEANCRYWFIEDIRDDAERTREELFRFLDLEPGEELLPAGFNRKSQRRKYPFNDEITALMKDYYAEETRECASLFGGHARNW